MLRRLVVLGACALLSPTWVRGENLLYFEDVSVSSGATGVEILLKVDSDVDVLGFSFGARYDPSALALISVGNEGTDAGAAEFFDGRSDETEGLIGYGCVVSVSGDPRAAKIPRGTGRSLAKLVFDVVATSGIITRLNLESVPTNPDPQTLVKNVLTDEFGRSVAPALAPGTITVVDLRPRIQGLADNEGGAGRQFRVSGTNFDVPELTVTVCGSTAIAELQPDDATILVTAPECGTVGWAAVRVCTERGCDERAEGFRYLPTGGAFLRGDANDDATVDIADGVSILVYLFLEGATPICLDPLDADDSGDINLSDAVTIFGYLFAGGPVIPDPFPEPGVDPTDDGFPDCP